jgi:hypothetical protein
MGPVEWVIAVVFLLILGLTVTAHKSGLRSVSTVLLDWGRTANSFAFVMGALVGHWFFPGITTIAYWPFLLIPILLLGALDIVNQFAPFPLWVRWPGIYVLLGIALGALLWAG